MLSSLDPTQTPGQGPVDPGQLVLLGLAAPLADAWSRAAQALGMRCAIASCFDECAAYALGVGPTVYAVSEPNFQPRMVSLADTAFRRTTLVVLSDNARTPFWRLIAWDSIPVSATPDLPTGPLTAARAEARRRLAECQLIEDVRRRQGCLGENELRVLEAICAGRLNKQIASDQNVSVRTVEQRRRRVFEKMGVESAVPLAAKMAVVQSLEDQVLRDRHSPLTGMPSTSAGKPTPPRPKLPIGLFTDALPAVGANVTV